MERIYSMEMQSSKKKQQEEQKIPLTDLTDVGSELSRSRMRQRLLQGNRAEVLHETVEEEKLARRRTRRFRVLIVILCLMVVTLAVGYYIVLPNVVKALPTFAHPPSQIFGTYKRVVKGFVDYFPPLPEQISGIAEVGRGGTFSFVSSADVVSSVGTEGVLRVAVDSSEGIVDNPDIDIGYKILQPNGSADNQFFVYFNKWPEQFDAVVPASVAGDTWLKFDFTAATDSPQFEGAMQVLQFFKKKAYDETRQITQILWRHALSCGALTWKVKDALRYSQAGKFISIISFKAAPNKIPLLLERLQTDAQGAKITGYGDLISAIRYLEGTVTIGAFDHVLYDSSWTFDVYGKNIGTLRGSVSSSVVPLQNRSEIQPPQNTKNLNDLLALVTLFDFLPVQSANATSSDAIDSDLDGLSDPEEAYYQTDSNNTDSDGDGYTDGEEIGAGYNPNGPGKLP